MYETKSTVMALIWLLGSFYCILNVCAYSMQAWYGKEGSARVGEDLGRGMREYLINKGFIEEKTK
jgi:hypothetical protein